MHVAERVLFDDHQLCYTLLVDGMVLMHVYDDWILRACICILVLVNNWGRCQSCMHMHVPTCTHTHTHTHTKTGSWVHHLLQKALYDGLNAYVPSPHACMKLVVREQVSSCSCYDCDICTFKVQEHMKVLFLVFSIFMPQVKTVTCGITTVAQPDTTLITKPLGVGSLVVLRTASVTPPFCLARPWFAWDCGWEVL